MTERENDDGEQRWRQTAALAIKKGPNFGKKMYEPGDRAPLDSFPHGRVGIGALGESRLLSTTS